MNEERKNAGITTRFKRTKPQVFIATVAAVVVAYYVCSHIFLILLGSIIPMLIFGYMILRVGAHSPESIESLNEKLRARFPRFRFTESHNWAKEVSDLNQEADADRINQLYPENFVISDTLHNLILLITRDFVESWYTRISPDKRFLVEVQVQIGNIVTQLQQRLSEIDLTETLVYRVLPLVTDHYANFATAQEIMKNRKLGTVRSFTSTSDLDKIVASCYNKGKLHPAIKLKSVDPGDDIQRWLSQQISKILPLIVDEKEIESPPIFLLLREILVKCVFFQIVEMLSDPDFYNQLVEKTLGNAMKDRLNVKRFRSALSKHSVENLRNSRSLISRGRLNATSDAARFHRILREINKCQSMVELKQYKYYVTLQLNKASRGEDANNQLYKERLAALRSATDKRLLSLLKSSSTLAVQEPNVNTNLDITFAEILNSPAKLSVFTEFMEQRRRTPLLKLWLVAEGLRNPLEDNYDLSEEDSSEDESDLEYSMTMAQGDDICQIFEEFFESPILKIDSKCYSNVARFVETKPADPMLYYKARKSLFKLQNEVYQRMQKTDYVAFKQSDLYLRLVAAEEQTKSEGVEIEEDETNGDPLADYEETGNEEQKVSDAVLRAVEDVLADLADEKQERPSLYQFNSGFSSSEDLSEAPSGTSTPRVSRLLSKDVQRDLFGEDMEINGLFDNNGEVLEDKESTKSMKIFDDENESLLDDDMTMSSSQELRLAAPGNLNLGDEIEKLGAEVDKLEQQLRIIEPLLNKAELTNNVSELNILRKTQAGLKKELQLKELQKQQYIVQESDNTLYGKSQVRIQSYLNGFEDGKECIMYIIEVQKLTADNTVTAGWMVARRFSQFFKLNNYLKSKFAEVGELDFPKRKVVLKFQQRSLIVERQRKLERYLQSLIEMREVCQDKVFRSFLSSEFFDINPDESRQKLGKLGNPGKSAVNMASKLYNNISNQWQLQYKAPASDVDDKPSLEMQKELSSLNENLEEQEAKFSSFVKPISDFLITVFWLKNSKVWLRGRAIVLVLQQLLGSTIEKMVRVSIDGRFKDSSTVASILTMLQDSLWPNGSFRKSGTPRTLLEKSKTKQHAKKILEFFIMDTCSKIFGASNSRLAAETTFHILQNQTLNRHLVLTVLQEVLETVFPEIER
ncbi:hypothetical protein KL933_004461 [Ogataea haglerorum]|uniref:Uncharacterized protein n=1 Tax=Ogataea haglerorum TaxID=1937702 RepID=A0AAN6HZ56_9ASCO|nr:hypothetical protein KL915_001600 [Ogataea haglerorum]KAG7725028.1 hypothetical protein KL933_004461 [Ogataea haglerorum]KAG7785202.1 hypothetical protein KL945_003967 [Ogataea haglerorum]KAG7785670.1 hypothetical protein KL910_004582 [Ogataea haglerorum]